MLLSQRAGLRRAAHTWWTCGSLALEEAVSVDADPALTGSFVGRGGGTPAPDAAVTARASGSDQAVFARRRTSASTNIARRSTSMAPSFASSWMRAEWLRLERASTVRGEPFAGFRRGSHPAPRPAQDCRQRRLVEPLPIATRARTSSPIARRWSNPRPQRVDTTQQRVNTPRRRPNTGRRASHTRLRRGNTLRRRSNTPQRRPNTRRRDLHTRRRDLHARRRDLHARRRDLHARRRDLHARSDGFQTRRGNSAALAGRE